MKIKFIYPIFGHIDNSYAYEYDSDDYEFDVDDYEYDLSSEELSYYKDLLNSKMKALQTTGGQCMEEFFDENEDVKAKLKSIVWGFEEFNGKLYGVTTAELTEAIDEKGIADLKEWISGQNSDGLGESFEQHSFDVDEGCLSVSLWNYDGYFIYTEEEFQQYLSTMQKNTGSIKKKKPNCKLIGEDGNIFVLTGIASRTLRQNDMAEEADEMQKRVLSSNSYDEALMIIGEYVTIV